MYSYFQNFSKDNNFFKCLFLTLDYLFVSARYMVIPFSDCKGAYGALVPFDPYSIFLSHGSFKIIIKYVNMKFTSFFTYVQCANNKRFFQDCTLLLIDNSYFFAWQNISKVQGRTFASAWRGNPLTNNFIFCGYIPVG